MTTKELREALMLWLADQGKLSAAEITNFADAMIKHIIKQHDRQQLYGDVVALHHND